MKDVGLAAGAELAVVRFGAEEVGAVDLGDLIAVEIILQHGAQIGNPKLYLAEVGDAHGFGPWLQCIIL
ncbi:MAG: hypothetical protein Kow006_07460 [Gammaproteobacteria bacterium]